ncbi:diguanylate cyclase [uncultured Ilyobacter sp.]|uniref:sensor domain-containing diguanylate cyclase n=1 Tax=uncultured Ilyobacter sp. TaxID=544433 RepID=UPI002AA7B568|nr:diguanylate cyclase [uncultured Ilyobacter sp.]
MGKFWMKFLKSTAVIILFIIFGVNYRFQMKESIEKFKQQADENYYLMDKNISAVDKLLNILESSGETYYKKNARVGNNNFNFKYHPKDDLYVSTDSNEERMVVGVERISTRWSVKKELDMSDVLASSYKNILGVMPDIAYIYYVSSNGFINIFPKISDDKYSSMKNIYKLDFVKKELFSKKKREETESFWSGVYKDPLGEDLLISSGAPIYEGNTLKGLITLGLKSDFFVKKINSELITDFFIVDEDNNSLSTTNLKNKEVSKFYDSLPKKIYDKRYKLPDMKPSEIEKIGKYYIYYEQCNFAPWRIYYVTDTLKLHKEMLRSNVLFISVWFMSLIFLYGVSKRKAVVEDSQQTIEKLQVMLRKSDREVEKDFLTGAFNRKGFTKIAGLELDRMKRYDIDACILMMDIDFFKKFNDTYGHACGDFVLRSFVRVVTKNVRLSDIVGRWGGEEFLVLLPETDYKGALLAAEKIRKMVEREVFYYHKQSLNITVTIGVSNLNVRKPLEKAVAEADAAMYRGKEDGRNRVVGFQDIRTKEVKWKNK